ncbi:hypothetical protein [Microbacterium oxydans]|nr:hypothetical protein [Microbacterium oxydans]WAA65610.1 hypothetical protein MME74_15460 [Microbacterium oxydans]
MVGTRGGRLRGELCASGVVDVLEADAYDGVEQAVNGLQGVLERPE